MTQKEKGKAVYKKTTAWIRNKLSKKRNSVLIVLFVPCVIFSKMLGDVDSYRILYLGFKKRVILVFKIFKYIHDILPLPLKPFIMVCVIPDCISISYSY